MTLTSAPSPFTQGVMIANVDVLTIITFLPAQRVMQPEDDERLNRLWTTWPYSFAPRWRQRI